MTTYRGMDGFLALGGHLVGSPLVNGAVLAGASSVDIDAVSLIGVVAPGDVFAVTGVSGTYTVTNAGFLVAAANAIAGITFTPVAPVGGFPDNAAVTFAANSVAQVRQWNVSAEFQPLETTVMGNVARGRRTAVTSFSGGCEVLFDYADSKQAALLDAYTAGTPNGSRAGVFFGVKSGEAKDIYGAVVLGSIAVTAPREDLVTAAVTFESNGQLQVNWP